ncbi:monovalent cation/H(+) antiporter subunit G [Rhizobium sp. S152]|uniref:monovalent cation/H(+) antiporter subunit G n=1 Tax=Rhizobium sp. S152 TaxID=3055038 RepID=UPI0025A95B26|nr:monovalent cation/H(+) antiporter subunit G [Rhizobium sp. S152]MDM9627100.1 monovalent cation/H(+) antiporter subunit G [Rhizobium sp. S152]
MSYPTAIVVAVLIVAGALFALVAALGLLRLPDLYTRMHAASKAGTVGSGLLLIAAGIASGEVAVLVRAVAGFVFFLLTAPVAAHLLARAAHKTGLRLGPESVRDDLAKR